MNEDPVNGIDDDGDGSIDEDPASDMNGDGCPGICGLDDDEDSSIDEGVIDDDDEDTGSFDDPYDPVVFYLIGSSLVQRTPVPWNEDGISAPDGPVDGRDFIVSCRARRRRGRRLRADRYHARADQPGQRRIGEPADTGPGRGCIVTRTIRFANAHQIPDDLRNLPVSGSLHRARCCFRGTAS